MSPCHHFGKVSEEKNNLTGKEILVKALSSLTTAFCCVFIATKVCNQSGSSFVNVSEKGPRWGDHLSSYMCERRRKIKDHRWSDCNCINVQINGSSNHDAVAQTLGMFPFQRTEVLSYLWLCNTDSCSRPKNVLETLLMAWMKIRGRFLKTALFSEV